jgi:hypothetical protein
MLKNTTPLTSGHVESAIGSSILIALPSMRITAKRFSRRRGKYLMPNSIGWWMDSKRS